MSYRVPLITGDGRAPLPPSQPPPAPRDPRTPRTKIIEGAETLFAQYGYYGTGLRAIASLADMTHAGLLHHFRSKRQLLDRVIDRLESRAEDDRERAEGLAGEAGPVVEFLCRILDPTDPRNHLLGRLIAESVAEDHPGRYRLARLRVVYEHVIHQCLVRLRDAGHAEVSTPSPLAARLLFSTLLGLGVRDRTVRRLQGPDRDDDPRADLRALIDGLIPCRPVERTGAAAVPSSLPGRPPSVRR